MKMAFRDIHLVEMGDCIGKIVDIRAAFPGTGCNPSRGLLEIQSPGKYPFFPVNHKRISLDGLAWQLQPDCPADIDRVVNHFPRFDLQGGVLARLRVNIQGEACTGSAPIKAERQARMFRGPAIVFGTHTE